MTTQDDFDLEDEYGWDDGKDHIQCPTCHGVGTIHPLNSYHIFCTSTVDCPDCDGTGEMP